MILEQPASPMSAMTLAGFGTNSFFIRSRNTRETLHFAGVSWDTSARLGASFSRRLVRNEMG